MLEFTLKISPQDFQVLWAALGELPMKVAYPVGVRLRNQVEEQERNALVQQNFRETPASAAETEVGAAENLGG